MKAEEKLSYIIERGKFKYADVKDGYGHNLCNFSVDKPETLISELLEFVNTWGMGKYKITFRPMQQSTKDRETVLFFDFAENAEPVQPPQPPQAQPQNLQGNMIDPKDIDKLVNEKITAILYERTLKEKEEEIKEREKQLDTQAGKFNYVLNNHIIPGVLNGLGINLGSQQIAPIPAPVLQGTETAPHPLENYVDPYKKSNMQIIDDANELSEEEVKQYQKGFTILSELLTAEQVIKLATRLKKNKMELEFVKNYAK